MTLSAGLTPRVNESGGIELVKAGKASLWIAPPDLRTRPARARVLCVMGWYLPGRLAADRHRRPPLAHSARPPVSRPARSDGELRRRQDCRLSQAAPSTSYCTDSELWVGWNGSHDHRALLK